ncbi:MAG: hypothetical protein MUE60_04670 [Candidatus Eisenbacteria bacterium]|jgi:hypothetical protein|nr:hypothetical protein [Candidatus Eisenbacteria bacterium]
MLTALMFGMVCTVCAITVHEQPETLIKGPVESGGFGGIVVKFTGLADQFAVLAGGRGGWIINHAFIIGGGGYGLVNEDIEISPAPEGAGPDYVLELGYGGVELEYVHQSRNLVHFAAMVLIGGGTAGFRDPYWDTTIDSDAFFVAEPGLNVELNISRPIRIDFGASYRFVSGLDLPRTYGLGDEDLRGMAGALTFKFGSF